MNNIPETPQLAKGNNRSVEMSMAKKDKNRLTKAPAQKPVQKAQLSNFLANQYFCFKKRRSLLVGSPLIKIKVIPKEAIK